MRDFTIKDDGRRSESVFEKSQRIRQILDSFGIAYKQKKGFAYVVCPFHAGSGAKNFWISPSGNVCRCHSCGHDTNWDGFAKALGLPKLRNDGPGVNGHSYLAQRVRQQEYEDDIVEAITLPRSKPWAGPWRGLTAKFLAHMGPRLWWDKTSEHNRILFPVTNDGKVVGYTAGRAEPELEYPKNDPKYPKYRTSRPLPTQKFLFMLDQVEPLPFIILVEGPYDSLRMVQAGMPAVAVMGATTWAPERTDLLLMRPGLKRVFAAPDSDEGGDKMWALVQKELKGHFPLSRIVLPPGKDPGDMSKRWLAKLKAELMGITGWSGDMETIPWARP